MTFLFFMVSAVLIILLIIPQILKRMVYKTLTKYLLQHEYEAFETCLDGFACTFSYRPYNREYMRLTAYIMQKDVTKIEAQLERMLKRLRMKDAQRVALAKQGFYFYLENKAYPKAQHMLSICKKTDKNVSELHSMEMMYSILALQKYEYITEIKERLEPLKKESDAYQNEAKRSRIGIFEYLLGLQYSYQNNQKTSQQYLRSAAENCKHTPYEPQIRALLKAKA